MPGVKGLEACPFCGSDDLREEPSGNGGDLYVAEEFFRASTECYVPDLVQIKCGNDHTFFVAREDLK